MRYVQLRPGLSVNPDNICGIELHHIENQTSHYLYEIVLHTVGGEGRVVVDFGHARDFGWYSSEDGDGGWEAFHAGVDARIAEISALLQGPRVFKTRAELYAANRYPEGHDNPAHSAFWLYEDGHIEPYDGPGLAS